VSRWTIVAGLALIDLTLVLALALLGLLAAQLL
jgi:hypothetical protein